MGNDLDIYICTYWRVDGILSQGVRKLREEGPRLVPKSGSWGDAEKQTKRQKYVHVSSFILHKKFYEKDAVIVAGLQGRKLRLREAE